MHGREKNSPLTQGCASGCRNLGPEREETTVGKEGPEKCVVLKKKIVTVSVLIMSKCKVVAVCVFGSFKVGLYKSQEEV